MKTIPIYNLINLLTTNDSSKILEVIGNSDHTAMIRIITEYLKKDNELTSLSAKRKKKPGILYPIQAKYIVRQT